MSQLNNQQADSSVWAKFYQANEGRALRPLFLKLMRSYPDASSAGQAIDLGCGEGVETLGLLQAGWRVLAIDKEAEGIQRLIAKTPESLRDHLQTRQAGFEQVSELPPSQLIYAGYSVPFCTPEYFSTLWNLIVSSLETGGRFAGELFGVRDAWSANPSMNFHNAQQVAALFEPFIIESLE